SPHVGKTELASLERIGEPKMIEPQQVQNGGLQIVDMNPLAFILRIKPQFIGGADRLPGFNATAGEPNGVGLNMMITSDFRPILIGDRITVGIDVFDLLPHRGPAELATPND